MNSHGWVTEIGQSMRAGVWKGIFGFGVNTMHGKDHNGWTDLANICIKLY